MAYFDLPIRSRKGLARAAHRRHLVQPMQSTLDEPLFPLPNRSIWHGGIDAVNELNINPYYASHNPLSQQSFFSNPSNAFQYNAAATYDPTGYTRRSNNYTNDDEDGIRGGTAASDSHIHKHEQAPPISFAKATRALYEALSAAEIFIHNLDQGFRHDTRYMAMYVEEATLAYLWKRLINWDGIDVSSQERQQYNSANKTGEANTTPPPPPQQSFTNHAHRVLNAMQSWHQASNLSPPPTSQSHPRAFRASNTGSNTATTTTTTTTTNVSNSSKETPLREEDVRLACRKLRVGCAALGELLQGVREERGRCAALLRELKSCRGVLEGIGVGGGGGGGANGGEEEEGGEGFE